MTRRAAPARRTRVQRIMRENFEAVRVAQGRELLRLKIDHQQFDLYGGIEVTKADVAWMKKQMAIALCRFKFGD